MENLYEILQCAPTASRDELRRAYTRLALKHHPDKRAQRKAAENSSHLASQERLSSTLTANVKQEANCIPIDSNHHLNSSASSFGRSGIERDSEMSFSLVDSDEHVCGLDSTSGSTTTKDELPECEFVKIDMAWKILGHDDLRAEYDIKWQDRCLMQEHPVQDTIPFEDFDFDASDEIYSYPCRCGSEFLLTKFDRQLFYDFVCCSTCSLTININYDRR